MAIINILKTRLDKFEGSLKGPLPDVRRVNIWPQIIRTEEAIPEEFRSTSNTMALCDSPAFPYMIYIPDYHWEMSDGGFQFVNLKSVLVVLDEDKIHIFKKSELKIISTINLSNEEKISILFSPDNKSNVDSVIEKYHLFD